MGLRPSLQWTLDSITAAPAIVGNNRSDLLATIHLGRALYADLYNDSTGAPNFARFTFPASTAAASIPTETELPTSQWRTYVPRLGRTLTTRAFMTGL